MARPRIPVPQIMKILMMLVAAIALILSKDACGKSVQGLFNTLAPPVSPAAPDAGQRRR